MEHIGRYRVLEELARGGMGVVYLGYDLRMDRQVAIKVLDKKLNHARAHDRFEQEAKVVAQVEHDAIVPIYDFGKEENTPYLVMRYMSGGSLQTRIKEPLTLEKICEITTRLAEALGWMHEKNFIHRDIKPENILFDANDKPYLADFGIARLVTTSGRATFAGTQGYMAPEQMRQGELDARTDIYQLALLVLEMLLGERPSPERSAFDYRDRLPSGCDRVLARALAEKKEQRYEKIELFAQAFVQTATSDAPVDGGMSWYTRVQRFWAQFQRFLSMFGTAEPVTPVLPPPPPPPVFEPPLSEPSVDEPITGITPQDIPSPTVCPFTYGSTVPATYFYGRERERMFIKSRIGAVAGQSVSIVGMRRSGKSSLLRYIQEKPHEFCLREQKPLVVMLDLQEKRFHVPEGLVEGLRRGIMMQIGKPPWKAGESKDDWAVDEGLRRLRDQGWRLVVLIDEFERINDRLDLFYGWGDDWRAKASKGYFALVIATLRQLDEVYEDCGLTSPFGNIFSQVTLGGWTDQEWRALVRDGFKQTNKSLSPSDEMLIKELGGGFPFYTQMAAALRWELANEGEVQQEFQTQVQARFRELWNDLRKEECGVLRDVAEGKRVALDAGLAKLLKDYGLLRTNGQLFSRTFETFIQEQSS